MNCPKCGCKLGIDEIAREHGYVKLDDDEKYHILLALKKHYRDEWCTECSSVEEKLQVEDERLAQALRNAAPRGE